MLGAADAAVPDASLRAMTGSVVELEVEGQPAVEGRLVGFEDAWVTVARADDNEVVSLPRERVVKLRAVDAPVEPPRQRIVGLHFGLSVSLMADARYERFYGFVNGNVLFPLTTLAGTSPWLAFAIGAGVSLPVRKGSNWHVDAFAMVLPLHVSGPYTYLGLGAGAGLRYDGPAGFTFAVKLPLVGISARAGQSPFGYDAPFRTSYAFGFFYLAGLMGLPLVSVGYRF